MESHLLSKYKPRDNHDNTIDVNYIKRIIPYAEKKSYDYIEIIKMKITHLKTGVHRKYQVFGKWQINEILQFCSSNGIKAKIVYDTDNPTNKLDRIIGTYSDHYEINAPNFTYTKVPRIFIDCCKSKKACI